MLSCAFTRRTHAGIRSFAPCSCVKARCAPFSPYARLRVEQQQIIQESLKSEQTSDHQGQGKSDDLKARPKRQRRVRGWAITGLCFIAGWYLSEYLHRADEPSRSTDFVKYRLVKKEPVSSTCSIFTLKANARAVVDVDGPASERQITSVEFKQPQLQIARSYTCLPAEPDQPIDEIRFLIRRESNGEVSGYLHRLPLQAEIEVRGPHVEYALPADVKSVVFLAGGTGIAPAMQVADILSGDADVHILWASRRREDCLGGTNDMPQNHGGEQSWWPYLWSYLAGRGESDAAMQVPNGAIKGAIVTELEGLKRQSAPSLHDSSRLRVDYFVDDDGSLIKPQAVKAVLDSLALSPPIDGSGTNVLFVSGPSGFVSHWAGPKAWINGIETQGPVTGALATLDLKGWSVIKM